jgi:hypothetical protein
VSLYITQSFSQHRPVTVIAAIPSAARKRIILYGSVLLVIVFLLALPFISGDTAKPRWELSCNPTAPWTLNVNEVFFVSPGPASATTPRIITSAPSQ